MNRRKFFGLLAAAPLTVVAICEELVKPVAYRTYILGQSAFIRWGCPHPENRLTNVFWAGTNVVMQRKCLDCGQDVSFPLNKSFRFRRIEANESIS